jgi:hypothetical protein
MNDKYDIKIIVKALFPPCHLLFARLFDDWYRKNGPAKKAGSKLVAPCVNWKVAPTIRAREPNQPDLKEFSVRRSPEPSRQAVTRLYLFPRARGSSGKKVPVVPFWRERRERKTFESGRIVAPEEGNARFSSFITSSSETLVLLCDGETRWLDFSCLMPLIVFACHYSKWLRLLFCHDLCRTNRDGV